MGTTARLIAFDLRRHRALAAAVLALEILRGLVVEWIGASGGAWGLSRADVFQSERVMVPLVTAGVNAVVTAILVLADRPDDDRAFWRTRPIAPARFALAKAGTLGVLLVGLPALVTAARLAWHHAPVAAMGAAAVQIAVVAGLIVAPAWCLAIATRRLVLFVPAAILAALAYLATGMAVLRASVNLAFGEGAVAAGGLDDVLWSRLQVLDWQRENVHGWPIAALFGAAGVVLLVWHYRHRRLAVTLAGMVLLLVAPRLWSWSAMDIAPEEALRQRLEGHVVAPLGLGTRTPAYYDRTGPWETAALTGRIGLPTLPRDISASVETGPMRLRTPGGTIVARGARQCCDGVGPIGLLDAGAMAKVPFHWGFAVPLAQLPRLIGTRADLEAPATVRLSRHVVVGRFTAAIGATFQTDRYRIEIVSGRGVSPAMEDRPAPAIRLVQFPTLRPAGDCYLWLLKPHRGGFYTILPEWWGRDGDEYLFTRVLPCSTWAGGRRWLTVRPEIRVTPGAPITVVESYPAGVVHTTIRATGVPITAVD